MATYQTLVDRYGCRCRLQLARRLRQDILTKDVILPHEQCYVIRWHIGVTVRPAYTKPENLDRYLEQFHADWLHYLGVSGIKESELEALKAHVGI